MISSAFRLPWPAAASWMEQRSPGDKPVRAAAGTGTHSSAACSHEAGDCVPQGTLFEVLGPANRRLGVSSGSTHPSTKQAGAVPAS